MRAGRLLIGPLLRRVVGTRATVWVETSAPPGGHRPRGQRRLRHRADLLRVQPPLRPCRCGGTETRDSSDDLFAKFIFFNFIARLLSVVDRRNHLTGLSKVAEAR